MLDEIVYKQRDQIEQFNMVNKNMQKNDKNAAITEDWAWVIKESYENLHKDYSDQLMILFVLCQLPNGLLYSDFEAIFHETHPNWSSFMDILIKYKQNMLDDVHEKFKDKDFDEETFWLVTFKHVDELNQKHYVPYQIVYSYINKSIISPEQRQSACKMVITHLSDLSRKIMRALRNSEIRILSLSKFTAAIDVGIWSDNDNFTDPSQYYKDYEKLIEEPRLMLGMHEWNFQQFLDKNYLENIFQIRMLKSQRFRFNLQDLMLTVPTLLIILNRKEEAMYTIER